MSFGNVGSECEAIRCFVGGTVLSNKSVKVKCGSITPADFHSVDGRQIRHVTVSKKDMQNSRIWGRCIPKNDVPFDWQKLKEVWRTDDWDSP